MWLSHVLSRVHFLQRVHFHENCRKGNFVLSHVSYAFMGTTLWGWLYDALALGGFEVFITSLQVTHLASWFYDFCL